jgi:hydrogenase nickel incorporation protein HypA/HybF
MHELAITESVVDAVVDRMGDAKVLAVRLEIGTLSGVVPDAVRFCFDLVASGTTVEGARLDIDEPAGRARCRTCGTELDLPDPVLLCTCGSADLEVLSGEQLRIVSVEVSRVEVG